MKWVTISRLFTPIEMHPLPLPEYSLASGEHQVRKGMSRSIRIETCPNLLESVPTFRDMPRRLGIQGQQRSVNAEMRS